VISNHYLCAAAHNAHNQCYAQRLVMRS
jgi:hypothetical protein